MAYEVKIPELGESVLSATLVHWLKQEGDSVAIGDPLAELETDKVDVEVSAQRDGVLAGIRVKEGQDVEVGEVIAEIREQAQQPEKVEPAPKQQEAQKPAAPVEEEPQKLPEKATPVITPVARRVAEEKGVDLEKVANAGDVGERITRRDVEAYATRQKPAPAKPAMPEQPKKETGHPRSADETDTAAARPDRPEERVRMSRRRRTIARRLVEAQQTAAMLTTFNEVDMSAVMELRRRQKARFQERYGVTLGIVSFFVKACAVALHDSPRLNAEVQGDEMVLKRYVDIGVAIGDEDGLVVPVLRDADGMSFGQIEQVVAGFVEKTRAGTLALDDLRGGTFTISNGGVFGSLLSTPILNPPQVGILGLHKIEDRPVAVEGEVVVRPMMYVALSYDHRIVDGREAVQFLARIKALVEDPGSLLLDL